MSKVMNWMLKGKKLTSSFGDFEFDENGIAEMDEEQAARLTQLGGYSLVVDEEPVQETTENDAPVNEIPEMETSSTEEETAQETDENAPAEEEEVDFASLNVPQLKKYAKEHDIDLNGATKKNEIIDILTAE